MAAGNIEIEVTAGHPLSEDSDQAELQERAPSKGLKEKPLGPLDRWRNKVCGRKGLHGHRSYSEQAYHKMVIEHAELKLTG
jgi:hypothetical protein